MGSKSLASTAGVLVCLSALFSGVSGAQAPAKQAPSSGDETEAPQAAGPMSMQELLKVALADNDKPAGIAATRKLLDADHAKLLQSAISQGQLPTALSAVRALGNAGHPRAIPLLRAAVLNEDLDWPILDQATRSLAQTKAGAALIVELAEAGKFPDDEYEVAGFALSRTLDPGLRKRAAALFPMPLLKDNKAMPPLADLLARAGDPVNGKEMFVTGTCNKCHMINDEGKNLGPDQSDVGARLSKEEIFGSILDPSANIAPEFQPYLFELKDGREITGIIASETEEKLTVKSEDEVVNEFAPSDIREKYELTISIMPTDLQLALTADEFVDLVEYLAGLK